MRFNGDVGCHPLQVWQAGLMDLVPDHVEHGVVGVAGGLGRNGWGAAILMRDLSAEFVRPGDDPIPLADHQRFLGDMAALAAASWGWVDDIGLVPLENRWCWFRDENIDGERQRGWPEPVPRIAAEGWERFAERVPADGRRGGRRPSGTSRRRWSPRIRTTPQCFLHGDWKLGNVGAAADGRTVLIDWTYPGSGPVAHDLAWYLALNRSRLPESKEDAIDTLGLCAPELRHRHHRLVRPSGATVPARRGRSVRVGEGARRRRRNSAGGPTAPSRGSGCCERGRRERTSQGGEAWQAGPGRIYDVLSEHLVAHSPVDLAGRRVLDLGAGTGAATRALLRRGACPIAVDVAEGMLRTDAAHRPPATLGDALGASPSHRRRRRRRRGLLAQPSPRSGHGASRGSQGDDSGGPILASAYASDDRHPVKSAVDRAAAEAGFPGAGWYDRIRADAVPQLASTERAESALRQANLCRSRRP